MMQHLQQLKEKDRWALGFAGVALIVYFFYFFCYSPLQSAVIEKEKEFHEKTQTLAVMKNVQAMAMNQRSKEGMTNPRLLSLLSAQFKKPAFQGFSYQIQQTSTGDIQIGFEQVPYGVMIQWLWDLTIHYMIDLKQVTIEPVDGAGIVKCYVILRAV